MKSTAKISVSVAVIMILSVLLIASVPPAKANFVLASWDPSDDYGQGIDGIELYENSTGSWIQVGEYHNYTEDHIYDWETNVSIKIICYTWFNSTLTDSSTTAEGQNYQRHSVSVTLSGESVFSQDGFTYDSVNITADPPQWLYGYEVILNFIPAAGSYYTVTINYEVFYA